MQRQASVHRCLGACVCDKVDCGQLDEITPVLPSACAPVSNHVIQNSTLATFEYIRRLSSNADDWKLDSIVTHSTPH